MRLRLIAPYEARGARACGLKKPPVVGIGIRSVGAGASCAGWGACGISTGRDGFAARAATLRANGWKKPLPPELSK